MKNIKIFILNLFAWPAVLLPFFSAQAQLLDPTAAQNIESKASGLAQGSGLNQNTDIGSVIQVVISAFLSLLGIIFILYIIYAGYNWMTAAGDEGKVETAKKTIQRCVIGLVIIIAAYGITYFVFNNIPFGESGYSF
jgi:hypothetical protein